MPHYSTILPGQPMLSIAAEHLLSSYSDRLADAVLLMPTRRACNLMRLALIDALGGKAALLPRILPIGDLEAELPGLLPPRSLGELLAIAPAMPEWHRLSLLMQQVMAFEQRRQGAVTFEHALGLARDLALLQDQCARHGIVLTMQKLQNLLPGDYAAHWETSLRFLSIVAETWPHLEREEGAILASKRQTQLLALLNDHWRETPPNYPVIAIGSTGSQPVTAALLQTIASMPKGEVILPGLDPRIEDTRWNCIVAGHPLFHIKSLLDADAVSPAKVKRIGDEAPETIWLNAMTCADDVPNWRQLPNLASHQAIRIVPCAHGEEEARALALLIRESLEEEGKRTALITPDENLMAHVAAHLERFGIRPDRIKQGTLATTETGSLWLAALEVINQPQRLLPILMLLRHPLIAPQLGSWLTEAEPSFRGLVSIKPGQLPSMSPTLRDHPTYAIAQNLVRKLDRLRGRAIAPSEWIAQLSALLNTEGEGADAVTEALEGLAAADILGAVDAEGFNALLTEALSPSWRGGIFETHPGIVMLTPVEARLERFDRIILANMQDSIWPGLARPSAWLNLAQQQALGLPSPEEQMSLMAHDVLLLGSAKEVFLTYPKRDQGSPSTRSRFIERLVALLAVHNIAEETLHAPHYIDWADKLQESQFYKPAEPPMPQPTRDRRPTSMAVSRLDYLTTDPYWLYCYYVLGLRELDPIDDEPGATDFGKLVHAALTELSHHWNTHNTPAPSEAMNAIRDEALRLFENRPEAALFWKQRLGRALHFVNAREAERRATIESVEAERSIEYPIALGEAELTLHGRLDRLEKRKEGVIIGDYKTGKAPTINEIQKGSAFQLLAYALLLETQGHPVMHLDYWELPAGRRAGSIHGIDGGTVRDLDLITQFRSALARFMNPETPLLAKPIAKTERFDNPYDGISRYDEWAG